MEERKKGASNVCVREVYEKSIQIVLPNKLKIGRTRYLLLGDQVAEKICYGKYIKFLSNAYTKGTDSIWILEHDDQ